MISCWGLMAYLKAADTPAERQLCTAAEQAGSAAAGEESRACTPPAKLRKEGFFADRPDIPVDKIFGKEEDK